MNEKQAEALLVLLAQLNANLVAQGAALMGIKEALDIGFSEVMQDLAEPQDEEDNEVATFG